MNGRHVFAAILTMMTVRVAWHRIAALHGLLGRSRVDAIERIAGENDGENYDQHSSCRPHKKQGRGTALCASMARRARNVAGGWTAAWTDPSRTEGRTHRGSAEKT